MTITNDNGGAALHPLIRALLDGEEPNSLLPFFWQHGEDEAVLREYMAVIQGANIGAVCVESRFFKKTRLTAPPGGLYYDNIKAQIRRSLLCFPEPRWRGFPCRGC